MSDCWISLYTTDTLLRYKSEWDPRAHAHTKGGYLDGEIRVPQVPTDEKLTMILETFPAEDVEPLVSSVHPCMLHVVRMGTGKRYNWLEPVPTKTHWKQTFEIEKGKVRVINTTSELDVKEDGSPRDVPLKDIVTELKGDSIILSGAKEHLNLVFLKPKQSKCDATISQILGDRLGINDEKKLKKYSSCFIGKTGGINLTKIRLKVSFYNSMNQLIAHGISPQTVVDNGNKNIGCMDMYDAWPRKSCSAGGRKVMMISEYDMANDVEPYFEVYDSEGNHRVEVEEQGWIIQPFNTPTTMTVKNSTIIFMTPAQPNLNLIRASIGDFYIKLLAKRKSDGLTSRAFNFLYSEHSVMCDHTVDGEDEARIEDQTRAKPKVKKRQMNNNNNRTLAVPSPGTPLKRLRVDSVDSGLLESIQSSSSPGGTFEMSSPSHSFSSCYNISSPGSLSMFSEEIQTVSITNQEIDENQIPADIREVLLPPIKEDTTFTTVEEVRDLLGMTKTKKEEEDWSSSNSIGVMSDEDDFLNNIDRKDLLDMSSPETLNEDSMELPTTLNQPIPSVVITSTYPMMTSADPMMTSADTMMTSADPMMTGLDTLLNMSWANPKQTKVVLQPRVQQIDEIQIDSTADFLPGLRRRTRRRQSNMTTADEGGSNSLLDQMPMLFTALFMMILCLVQMTSTMAGFSLPPLPLVGLSALLSLGVVAGKCVKTYISQ